MNSIHLHLQLWPFANGRLLNEPYENEVILNAASLFILESVDKRALKLLAVKVGGLEKKSAALPRPNLNQSAQS